MKATILLLLSVASAAHATSLYPLLPEYRGMSRNQLVQTHVRAYRAAGFRLVERTDKYGSVHLVFAYPFKSGKPNGKASLWISSVGIQCSPCKRGLEFFDAGVDTDHPAWKQRNDEMEAARRKADQRVDSTNRPQPRR